MTENCKHTWTELRTENDLVRHYWCSSCGVLKQKIFENKATYKKPFKSGFELKHSWVDILKFKKNDVLKWCFKCGAIKEDFRITYPQLFKDSNKKTRYEFINGKM